MKKLCFIALLLFSWMAQSQTEADFCSQAQVYLNQSKYLETIRAVGRALAKNPDNASCRKLRITAAIRTTPATADMYVEALTDLQYLTEHGDKSEWAYQQTAQAEGGLAGILYQDRDYKNAVEHYTIAKEAYQHAQGVTGDAKYLKLIEDTDTYIRQAKSEGN